jgi:hypothetical protein
MVKVKEILSGIERNKSKISKFLIICASINFLISTLYRLYSSQDSRTLIETMINLYSLFIVVSIFLHEFLKCFLLTSIVDNFKAITHLQGQGLLFILVSLVYMSRSLGTQQNYSAYLLFFVGIILIALDRKLTYEELKEERVSKPEKDVEIVVENITQEETKKEVKVTSNPYDIPEDF